jgi:hypothetical protein
MGKKVYLDNREKFFDIGQVDKKRRYRNSDGTYASNNDYDNSDFWSF